MNRIKAPLSLRTLPQTSSSPRGSREALLGVSLVAAFCMVDPESTAAQAPTASQLPTMTVDAPAATKKKRRVVRQVRPASLPSASPVSAPADGATAPTATPGAAAANANPYANPGAPWKVDRSASTKLTEPLLNTPRTITAIPKEVMEDKGATSLRDLVRTTPGLTLGTGEGGNAFGDRVFIRGFDARNDMYIDGIRESGVTTRETFMTEQVEVVKGPSGSISGRGTAGGAINVVTKKPSDKNFYIVEGVGGTDKTRRATADINHAITPNFAVRVNALFQQAEVAGRDFTFDDRYGGAIAATWKPTDYIKTTVDYYHMNFNQLPDWGVPFDQRTRLPFTEAGLRRANFYGLPNRDFQHNSQDVATAALEFKVSPDVVVNSKTRFGNTITDYVAGKPGTPNLANVNPALWFVPSTPASRYQVNRTIANQTDATLKFDALAARHTVVAGVEVSREDVSQDSYTGLTVECFPNCVGGGTGVNLNLWNPNANAIAAAATPTRNGRPTITMVDTRALYALDTINWYDIFILNGGIRLDSYEIARTPFAGTTLRRSDLMPNWNAGIVFKPTPFISLYGAYATSSNPVGSELDGGADDYGGLTATNVVFQPEKNKSMEAGTKWEMFGRGVLVTAAVFQTEKTNARETIGAGATARLSDTAAYRVYGVDLGISGNLSQKLSVFGGVVLMGSEVTQSLIAANLGQPLANIAHQSFNLLTKYKVTDALSVGGQATYKGEILGGTLAAVNFPAGTTTVAGVPTATPGGYNRLPAGWRFDLMAEYEVSKQFSAKIQVQNIFDKVLYDAFYRSATPYVYIAPGRVAYFTLKAKFE